MPRPTRPCQRSCLRWPESTHSSGSKYHQTGKKEDRVENVKSDGNTIVVATSGEYISINWNASGGGDAFAIVPLLPLQCDHIVHENCLSTSLLPAVIPPPFSTRTGPQTTALSCQAMKMARS
ncbi:Coronin [Mycena indigotica]|uniref:Coronin n=1 Tax=Mycena indigotica TaxID=2126181 RepID=A0A8H6WCR6_9AGAR|nr:Coronin [Mycena indigotica]KAF7311701.1 Coronin [Mycena indigotica]